MTTDIILSRLTGSDNSKLAYSTQANAFLGNGFTSSAGNHYYNALRFTEGILIKEDIGQGYKYTFLNGIKIYSLKDRTLITEEAYHNVEYSDQKVKQNVKVMLLEKLKEASLLQGFTYDVRVAELTITQLIENAFLTDQRQMAEQQFRRLTD